MKKIRNRIFIAALGLAVAGLAMAGLLVSVDLLSSVNPSDASTSTPKLENNGVSPPKIPQILPELLAGQSSSPTNKPSAPSISCPVCQGEQGLGSGLCPVCGGTGKLDSISPSPVISPQGGLGPNIPLFTVNGATNTNLLRSVVTSGYDGTLWNSDPGAASYIYEGEMIKTQVQGFSRQITDEIKVTSIEKFLSSGVTLPTSLYPVAVTGAGQLTYFPTEQKFVADEEFPANYFFKATHYEFSPAKLNEAQTDPDPKYLQVPSNTSSRIKQLAMSITNSKKGPFQKAFAIENYLKENYEYDLGYRSAPSGHEANDWFLFEEKKGVCSNFNSAFVILSRVAGIPSRLVDGYKINPQAGDQVVYANQAHAWSEIKLKDLGWITFDATGTGRGPLTTKTEIDSVTSPVIRGKAFSVNGTVLDSTGHGVDGVPVELFINPKKETGGGIPVGEGTVSQGAFKIDALIPVDADPGKYQLMAHSLGGIKYLDSWSDPPLTVLVGTIITLDDPGKIKINEQVMLKGVLTEDSSKPMSGQTINISIGDQFINRLSTDIDGRFTVILSLKDTGDYILKASFPGTEYYVASSKEIHFQVLKPTTLNLKVPQEIKSKESMLIRGSLLEEASGLAMPDQKIEITIDGQLLETRAVTTASGEFTLEYKFKDEGLHQIETRFASTPYFFESRAEAMVEVISARAGFNWLWLLLIPLVGLIIAGLFILFRRNKPKSPVTGPKAIALIETGGPSSTNVKTNKSSIRLNIELPGIEHGLPDVWGAGDELEVVCILGNLKGEALGNKNIKFLIGSDVNTLTTDIHGAVTTRHTFDKKGQYQLVARYEGDEPDSPVFAKREVKIVDYREEIVDLFKLLLVWLRSGGLDLPDEATPREIVQKIGETNAFSGTAVDQVGSVFEEADYSLHAIGRERYKTMYFSQKEIKEHEPAPQTIA